MPVSGADRGEGADSMTLTPITETLKIDNIGPIQYYLKLLTVLQYV